MSLYDARMPSLKDKIRGQAEAEKAEKVETKEVETVTKKKTDKGRRLNK